MNKCSCDSCLFSDQCSDDYPCEHYSPVDDDQDLLIEAGRVEYRMEWSAYIRDAEASNF